jgi:hypothetical protein
MRRSNRSWPIGAGTDESLPAVRAGCRVSAHIRFGSRSSIARLASSIDRDLFGHVLPNLRQQFARAARFRYIIIADRRSRLLFFPLSAEEVTAMIGIECSEASASALTDAICLPAKAAFPAASQQDGNSGSVPRSPPTIQSGAKTLNRDTCHSARRSSLPHCDRAGSS